MELKVEWDLVETKEIYLLSREEDYNDEQEVFEMVNVSTDFTIIRRKTKALQAQLEYVTNLTALKLKEEVLDGVITLNLHAPTILQRYLLPVLLSDSPVNVYVQSEWNTGKRTASILAMLNVIDPLQQYPQVICLSSTYELAIQNQELAANMASFYPAAKFWNAVEEVSAECPSKISEHIIFGIPEYVVQLNIKQERFDLSKIKMLVLQDADVICNDPNYCEPFYHINRGVNKQCRKIYFASEYNYNLVGNLPKIMHNPYIIKSNRGYNRILNNITQFSILTPTLEQKNEAVVTTCLTFYKKSILIFCSTPIAVKKLAVNMIINKFDVTVCTCDLSPQQRVFIYKKLQSEECKILIATDVVTQGINLNEFDVVCNFDVPVNSINPFNVYIDRVTRSGNMLEKGIVLNLIDSEESLHYYKNIENVFSTKIISIKPSDIRNICEAQILVDLSNS